jgi:uncharacterized membrane protein
MEASELIPIIAGIIAGIIIGMAMITMFTVWEMNRILKGMKHTLDRLLERGNG